MTIRALSSPAEVAKRRLAVEDHEILKAAEALAEQAGLLPKGLAIRRAALRRAIRDARTPPAETDPQGGKS